ncbi:LOW QUALITY PROTEIN: histone H3-like centromeric protein A, partial [Chroicocephalus ridibundus]|uniref:LOW QUALITY PROTEIN: histone H3-like centromeric protein A n=1 Tax=Chroicocephalus ridibundus TaxID=1192867 RepID=UPI002FDEC3FD
MPRPKPPAPRRRGRPPSPPPPSPRRTRRRRPGQRALQEIRQLQSSTRLLLRPGPFARLVREICLIFTRGVDYRW